MEKRLSLALVLSVLLILVVNVYLFPSRPDAVKPEDASPSPTVPDEGTNTPGVVTPPVGTTPPAVRPPLVSPSDAPSFVLENDALRVVISAAGASVREAYLREEHATVEARRRGVPMKIVREIREGLRPLLVRDLSTPESWLESAIWEATATDREVRCVREVIASDGRRLRYTKVFSLEAGHKHDLGLEFSCQVSGGAANAISEPEFRLTATGGVFQEVTDTLGSVPTASLVFSGNEVKSISFGEATKSSDGEVRKLLDGDVRYVADTSTYFGGFFVLRDFPKARVRALVRDLPKSDDRAEKGLDAGQEPDAKRDRTQSDIGFSLRLEGDRVATVRGLLYLGRLSAGDIARNLERPEEVTAIQAVYKDRLGFFALIARGILALLSFFERIVRNWGFAIVLMTVTVRLLLFPINRRSQSAMMRHGEAMKRLKPKLDELKKKYQDEPQKFGQEQLKLMKSEGVSLVPLGGCLPMFLQLPIFFGLFSALRVAADLRQAPWIWVDDLSKPDHLIDFGREIPNPFDFCCGIFGMHQPPFTHFNLLPILMTAAMMVSAMLTPKPEAPDPQLEQQRKMMMFMPLLMGVMLYNYPAGLSLYVLTSSLLGIVETRVIRKVWPVKAPVAKAAPPAGPSAKGSKKGR